MMMMMIIIIIIIISVNYDSLEIFTLTMWDVVLSIFELSEDNCVFSVAHIRTAETGAFRCIKSHTNRRDSYTRTCERTEGLH
jgi:hypothetical protein